MTELLPEFIHELKQVVSGGVRTDLTTRILYSTDASIYQIEPLGVVYPRNGDELSATVEIAARFQVPILARGSGSSIAGQAIGHALILDCSRYLNRILDINAEERTAQVEPGVILNTLNRKAAGVGLQFGPDPASAERATMGGSLSNNATGAHSITYGMAADHFLSASVVLSDGSLCDFSAVPLEHARKLAGTSGEADRMLSAGITQTREAIIYRAALEIRENYDTAIHQRWPITWRRASGYSLNYLLPFSPTRPPLWSTWDRSAPELPYPPVSPNTINLAPLLAGSEGTLAIIRHATLRLVPLPKHTVLGVLAYPNLVEACEAAPYLLDHNPSAIELIPQSLILLARSVPAYAAQLSFINQLLIKGEVPSALLVVEFAGDNLDELRAQAARLAPGVFIADTQAIQRQVWGVRKVAMGLLSSRPGNLKSIAFIEDLAVPVSHLGEFVREMQRILAENNSTGEFAAHASAGCLHIRPMLDLGAPGGTTILRKIAQEAVSLTIRLGGSVSGEHGDGLARSEWLQQMYGAELIQAFRALKYAADPQNLLNPGKILDSQPVDTNLRVEKMKILREWHPVMDFSRQAGISGAIDLCNGAGVCRKTDGVMCPSFQVMQEEIHSTRGRANLLRAMIYAGDNSTELAELSASVFEALDLCLACKGCKAECPSAVDIARLKYEFLYTYYKNNTRKLRDYLFAYIGRFTRLGQPIAPILNPLLGSRLLKLVLEKAFGVSRKRPLPSFARQSLQKAAARCFPVDGAYNENVLFLSDPFTEYYYPENGLAAISILLKSGICPIFVPILGAGRTLLSKGFLPAARRHAARLVEMIYRMDPDGQMPIVGLEPSEVYTLSDEFLDLLPQDGRAISVASRAWMIDEFLLRPAPGGKPRLSWYKSCNDLSGETVYLHGHCYQKARPPHSDGYPTGVAASVALLKTAGYNVKLIDSGCCGMAGAFGYEVEHYQMSMQVGEMSLFPALREASNQLVTGDLLIAASGVSCHAQIEDGVQKSSMHPIQLFLRKVEQVSGGPA